MAIQSPLHVPIIGSLYTSDLPLPSKQQPVSWSVSSTFARDLLENIIIEAVMIIFGDILRNKHHTVLF
jgi:hypothetical protein